MCLQREVFLCYSLTLIINIGKNEPLKKFNLAGNQKIKPVSNRFLKLVFCVIVVVYLDVL